MQNIGERLEEARKRKGISIREAAEATKIRGDFLLSFEKNQFSEISLPDIYKRGFLKIYTNYLELDAEKLLADYTAHQLGNSRLAKKEGREFFGRMDIPAPSAENGAPTSAPEPAVQEPEPRPVSPSPAPKAPEEERYSHLGDVKEVMALDKSLYWKIGIGATGAFILFLLIYALIKAITSGGDDPSTPPSINPDVQTQNVTPPDTSPGDTASTPPVASGDRQIVTLIATGEVFVQVKQLSDGNFLYRGTLSTGERVPLTINGSADIAFTQGSNLQIEKDGQIFEPDTSRSQVGKINTDNL